MRRTVLSSLVVAAALLATACTPQAPELDAEAAMQWARSAQESVEDVVATGTMRVAAEQPSGAQISIRLAEPVAMSGLRAACYGGGEVDLTYSVRAGSSVSGATRGIPCDEEFHGIEAEAFGVTLLEFSGQGAESQLVIVVDGVDAP